MEAGCKVDVDKGGNMFATRPARCSIPPIATGSHLDTQPHGGKFDGIYGVMAGLEVIRTLNDVGVETEIPLSVINWTNEEGVRFPTGLLGSTAFAEHWPLEKLHQLRSVDGSNFGEELARIGYCGDLKLGEFAMTEFYEAHIEQGPVLEREDLSLGIVEKIQGLRWFEITVSGTDQHAGTTPMDARNDSLVAAAHMIVGLNNMGLEYAPDLRVTVGRLDVIPNSGSTIAGKTIFNIDLRHPLDDMLDRLESEIRELCNKVATRQSTGVVVHRGIKTPAVKFDDSCIANLEAAAKVLGIPYRRMLSGALHDASPISSRVPSAMIFVPCRDGVSHNESEWTDPAHLQTGCDVLLHAMLRSAGIG
jgi:N-carbamoyl-L-amino-acid hydrolase